MGYNLVGRWSVVFVYQEQRDNIAQVVGNFVGELVKVGPVVFASFKLSVNVLTLRSMEWRSADSECVPASVSGCLCVPSEALTS
jgi:hypothetical protein